MISVVVPAWNAAATLPETLASIAAQTCPAEDVIVVDDGSTDETGTIAAAAGVRLIRTEQRGSPAALNTGIAASRGDFLGLLDADDIWPTDKLALQSRYLEEHPELDGVFGHFEAFLCSSVTPEQAAAYSVAGSPQPGWLSGAMLIRRQAALATGDFLEDISAGFFVDWIDRARMKGVRFGMMPQVTLRRRIRPGSLSHRSPTRDTSYVRMAFEAIRRRRGEGNT